MKEKGQWILWLTSTIEDAYVFIRKTIIAFSEEFLLIIVGLVLLVVAILPLIFFSLLLLLGMKLANRRLKKVCNFDRIQIAHRNLPLFMKEKEITFEILQKTGNVVDKIDNGPIFISLVFRKEIKTTHSVLYNYHKTLSDKLSALDNAPQGELFKLSTQDEIWENRAKAYQYLV